MTDRTQFLLERRTIREYSPEPVSEELLRSLAEKACRASTTGNMQLYSIVVTRNPARKAELAPLHFNQRMVTAAPVVLTFCADFNRFNTWCRQRNAKPGYDNFLSFFTAAIDALLVAQTFCIAAEGEGFGICYLGTVTYNAGGIIKLLSLPRGVVPVASVTLGWPSATPAATDRLPLDAIMHDEEYKDYSASDIDYYYSAKENLPDSIKFVAENSKETLAQVFTDVRYKRNDNVNFSKSLLQVLEEQGYMNQ